MYHNSTAQLSNSAAVPRSSSEFPRQPLRPLESHCCTETPDGTLAGSPYQMSFGEDVSISGTIEVFRSPVHFAGTGETLDQSFLFLEMEPARRGCRPAVWLSTYGMDPARREKLQQKADQMMNRLFGTLEKLPKV